MQMLGLYYTVASGKDVNALVDLSKDASGKVALRGEIRDVLGINLRNKSINFNTRGQVIKDCLRQHAVHAGVPSGWWNEDLSQEEGAGKKGYRGKATLGQRRKRTSRHVAVSPPLSKLKQEMQKVRDDRGGEFNGEKFPFDPPISIKNPAVGDRTRWHVAVNEGTAEYTLRTSQRKAVLCSIVTGLPTKLLAWHQQYGFVAKALAEYQAMARAVLVGLLQRTGYVEAASIPDDHQELAELVHKKYTTLNICLWGDNADLASRSHAAFLWHIVYYPWQWENEDAFGAITEQPCLLLLCEAGAGRADITRCIERVTEDFLAMEGKEVPVNRTSVRIRLKYLLGDEHFLAPGIGVNGSGNADTSYASVTSAAQRRDFKAWVRSFFCQHWRPAEIVSHVQKSGYSHLNIGELKRPALCDLLDAMGGDEEIDLQKARDGLTKSQGGCNQDDLQRAATVKMQGACAVPGWSTANPNALIESDMLKEMRAARDAMHSCGHNIKHCLMVVKRLEGTEVAASIEKEMKAVGCGEGTMIRCCDYRMVAAKHAKVFAHCQVIEPKRLMELCGHLTKIAYLHPNKRTRKTILAFGVLAMEWQALLKSLCPKEGTKRQFKGKHGMSHTALFGRYFHFWSMEAVLQTRLQSLRCTITERHEAFFAVLKPILSTTSNYDENYLLRAAERQQMEEIFKGLNQNARRYKQESTIMTQAFDSTSDLSAITLSHEQVASSDYLVFCCMFADYMSDAWIKVKAGSPVVMVNGRSVQEVVIQIGAAGGNDSAWLFSDVWDDVASMKTKLQVKMQTHVESGEVPGWERGSMLTAMRTR
jgi:hypothetical protein